MTAKEILDKHHNTSDAATIDEISITTAMREYAREMCKLQREKCAEVFMQSMDVTADEISNAPEPEME